MGERIHILGIAGSLRQASYNRGLLRAAAARAQEGMEIETSDLSDIPPYNQDLEMTRPQSVVRLKQQLRAADGVLIANCTERFDDKGELTDQSTQDLLRQFLAAFASWVRRMK